MARSWTALSRHLQSSALLALCAAAPFVAGCSRSKPSPAPPLSASPTALSGTPTASAASAASAAADGRTRAAPKVITGPLPGLLTNAVFLPNKHVLLHVTKRFVFDWDPTIAAPSRRTEVARESSEGVTVWLTSGSSRFVVGSLDPKKKLTLELWDAEGQTKSKTLANNWRGDDPIGRTSDDGSRFLLMSSVFRPPESSDNELVVYDLAEGNLVRATKLPTLPTERYMLSPAMSPSGKYFSISHPYFPVEVRSSDTGKVIVRAPESGLHYGDGGLFVDETHFLYAAGSSEHLRLTDLTTGRAVHSLDLKMPTKDDSVGNPVLSPDHKRVAIPIKRARGAEIAIWNLEDGKSATFAVPLEICPQYCMAVWTSAKDVVASRSENPPSSSADKLRIDVESGTTAPARLGVLHFAAGGFEMLGEQENGSGSGGDAGPLHVMTPSRVRVDLPDVKESWGLHHEVSGDRLLIWRENMVKVIAKDGTVSSLAMKSTPPPN